MKAFFALTTGLVVAVAAACGGSSDTGDLNSSAAADAGEPPVDTTEVEAGADPFGGPSVCTSGTKWTNGDRGSSRMHPGGTCLDCHKRRQGTPSLTIAGTVYPTGHEPTDCNGVNGSTTAVKVVITDATGKTITLDVNAAGNFHTTSSFTPPYKAKVVANGMTRAMGPPQTSGDCNSCHTEEGANGAPGRIVLP